MGSQVTNVHITLFASVWSVLHELPKLIRAAHSYNLVVELGMEFLPTYARTILIFLSQVNGKQCAIKKSRLFIYRLTVKSCTSMY